MDPRAFLVEFVDSSKKELTDVQPSMSDMKAQYYHSVPDATRRVIRVWIQDAVQPEWGKEINSRNSFCAGLYLATQFEQEEKRQTAASHIEFVYPCRTTSYIFASPRPSDRKLVGKISRAVTTRKTFLNMRQVTLNSAFPVVLRHFVSLPRLTGTYRGQQGQRGTRTCWCCKSARSLGKYRRR